jgi:hypothetical protein
MASCVIDHGEGRAAMQWPQRPDRKIMGLTVIIGDLIGGRY